MELNCTEDQRSELAYSRALGERVAKLRSVTTSPISKAAHVMGH